MVAGSGALLQAPVARLLGVTLGLAAGYPSLGRYDTAVRGNDVARGVMWIFPAMQLRHSPCIQKA